VTLNFTLNGGLAKRLPSWKGETVIGDSVRVAFKEEPKRIGSILDIEYFEKIT
jgi:uncharacterized OB-fold protein